MHLARVTGAVVSTQKSPSLVGKKLLLVRRVSAGGGVPPPPTSRAGGARGSLGAGGGGLGFLRGRARGPDR
ncbi:EutN/CcmL family microcompartment protein, partial [Klebsiella michiganensis]|uniref:EutN/CcmL family microcompartment protein n=1 Tax=Klebsiella michiganensis TaxID=1134687 RepID=UPI0020B6A962